MPDSQGTVQFLVGDITVYRPSWKVRFVVVRRRDSAFSALTATYEQMGLLRK